MKALRNGSRIFLLLAILLLGFAGQAFCQEFPTKPITIYCGQEAGATTDITARALAEMAKTQLGVPVVVENKAGGGATVAATLLSQQEAGWVYVGGFLLRGIGHAPLDLEVEL